MAASENLDIAELKKQMKEGKSNILVAVRVRPLSKNELIISSHETLAVDSNKQIYLNDPQFEMNVADVLRENHNRSKQYAFDFVFDRSASQALVFANTTQFLVDGLLKGYNATIFAYGATGAGKTYTMMGQPKSPGVIPQTLDYLFELVNSRERGAVEIKVSYVEVYNEVIRDLLTSEDAPLDIREDPDRGVTINGVLELSATSQDEIMRMFKLGSKNRMKEPTEANEVSSRSHAVFLLTIEAKDEDPQSPGVKVAKLNMIDLAGSERAAYTNNKGIRMIEGANINRSLLALGNCINALSDKQKGGKKFHVPYRDSKLTRLLKESLCGNCRTVMIANVSPAVTAYEDTLNTLKYANRAKSIKTYSKKNVKALESEAAQSNQQVMSEYADIISSLKKENQKLKSIMQHQVSQAPLGLSSDKSSKVDDSQVSTIQNLEKKINQCFQEENECLTRFHAAEDNLDNLKQSLVKSLGKVDEATKSYLTNLKVRKQQFEEQLQRAQDQREALLREIEALPKNAFPYQYCMSLYEKEDTKIKNAIAKRKRVQNENTMKYLSWANIFLKNQVKLRDNILYEQKLVLDRNQIDNDITYDGLKAVDKIDSGAKRLGEESQSLPSINPHRVLSGVGNRYNRNGPQQDRSPFTRRNSNSSMNLQRIANAGGRQPVGYAAARNRHYIGFAGNQLQQQRKVGSSYQKKPFELPEYLRDRVQINQPAAKRQIIKSSQEDRSLSYNRRLHNAIYQRNQLVSSSRSPARLNPGYPGLGPKKKVGVFGAVSQPTLPARRFMADINKSPYVQQMYGQPDKKYVPPESLRLIKANMQGNFAS